MRLEAIEDENEGKPVHAKWQAMIQARRFGLLARDRSLARSDWRGGRPRQVLIMTQAHTLPGFGYEATQEGLQRYRADLHALDGRDGASAPSRSRPCPRPTRRYGRSCCCARRRRAAAERARRRRGARRRRAAAAMQTRAFMEERPRSASARCPAARPTPRVREARAAGDRGERAREQQCARPPRRKLSPSFRWTPPPARSLARSLAQVVHSRDEHAGAPRRGRGARLLGRRRGLRAAAGTALVEHMFDQQIVASMNAAMIASSRAAPGSTSRSARRERGGEASARRARPLRAGRACLRAGPCLLQPGAEARRPATRRQVASRRRPCRWPPRPSRRRETPRRRARSTAPRRRSGARARCPGSRGGRRPRCTRARGSVARAADAALAKTNPAPSRSGRRAPGTHASCAVLSRAGSANAPAPSPPPTRARWHISGAARESPPLVGGRRAVVLEHRGVVEDAVRHRRVEAADRRAAEHGLEVEPARAAADRRHGAAGRGEERARRPQARDELARDEVVVRPAVERRPRRGGASRPPAVERRSTRESGAQ